MKELLLKLFILSFCFFLFSFGSQNMGLGFKGDENFYFESAKEMFETKDIITPRYMGVERFQKPIFFYWLILASFKMFGIDWFAARLPSILFGTFLALLIFALSNLLFKDMQISLFASLFAINTPLYYRYARLAVPDMTLIFFMTLALYYFARLHKTRQNKKSTILFFIALAFAFLSKGPIGLIIPLLIIGIFCLIKKEKKLFDLKGVSVGIFLFILIAGPWFYVIYRIHGGTYLHHVWAREILQRLGSGCSSSFIANYFKGFFFYLTTLIIRFFPYSLFMPIAFINSAGISSARHAAYRKEDERDAHLFLNLWLVSVFFFFTFVAERRAHYLLALAPAASILVAKTFKEAILDKQYFLKPGFKIPYFATLIAIAFFAIAYIFSEYIIGEDKIPIWKFSLLIIPVILNLGFHYRNNILMPSSLVFSIAALYIATSVSTPFGLFMNKMERAAVKIKSELKQRDRIGIGSHGIIPEELQVFFEIPVEDVKVMDKSDGTLDQQSALGLLQFLGSKERTFCVIKRKDYDNFISADIKENLYILDRYYVWKRRIKFDKALKQSIANVNDRSLREIFQNEIYVISNSQ